MRMGMGQGVGPLAGFSLRRSSSWAGSDVWALKLVATYANGSSGSFPVSDQYYVSGSSDLGPPHDLAVDGLASIVVFGYGSGTGDTVSLTWTVDGTQVTRLVGNANPDATSAANKAVRVTAPPGAVLTLASVVGTTGGGYAGGCLVAGTQVWLADGSRKAIEDVGPSDSLLAVAPDMSLVPAKPAWIMDPVPQRGWYLCRFASGRTLCTAGAPGDPGHRVLSLDTMRYEYERDAIGHRVLSVDASGAPGEPVSFRASEDVLESVEHIDHPCVTHNVITDGPYSLVAEGLATSCRLSNPGMPGAEVEAYWKRLGRLGRVYG